MGWTYHYGRCIHTNTGGKNSVGVALINSLKRNSLIRILGGGVRWGVPTEKQDERKGRKFVSRSPSTAGPSRSKGGQDNINHAGVFEFEDEEYGTTTTALTSSIVDTPQTATGDSFYDLFCYSILISSAPLRAKTSVRITCEFGYVLPHLQSIRWNSEGDLSDVQSRSYLTELGLPSGRT